jgi:3',5'-cyclic AMP phosphodiesterase CpdA
VTGKPSVTLLHLSDIQFGKNHRFGGDEQADTLLKRLIQDLEDFAAKENLKPDLLVLTGDLAEWGRKSEFDKVYNFVDGALPDSSRCLGPVSFWCPSTTTSTATCVKPISKSARRGNKAARALLGQMGSLQTLS